MQSERAVIGGGAGLEAVMRSADPAPFGTAPRTITAGRSSTNRVEEGGKRKKGEKKERTERTCAQLLRIEN